jgi:hypothetical protein
LPLLGNVSLAITKPSWKGFVVGAVWSRAVPQADVSARGLELAIRDLSTDRCQHGVRITRGKKLLGSYNATFQVAGTSVDTQVVFNANSAAGPVSIPKGCTVSTKILGLSFDGGHLLAD